MVRVAALCILGLSGVACYRSHERPGPADDAAVDRGDAHFLCAERTLEPGAPFQREVGPLERVLGHVTVELTWSSDASRLLVGYDGDALSTWPGDFEHSASRATLFD